MTVSVSTLELLVNAGLSGEALLNVVRSIESDNAKPVRSKNAERQARHRERVKNGNVTHNVTDNAESNVTPPLSSLSLSPTPPIQNPTNPPPPYSPPAPWAERIWEITPKIGRERSSRRDLERSLAAAVRRGHDPEAIRQAVASYYASDDASRDGGQFAKGVHRLIENDRWASHAKTVDPPDWGALVSLWRETGRWASALGPPPDHPETQVPQQLRAA